MNDLCRIAVATMVTMGSLWGQPDTQERRLTSNVELHQASITEATLAVLRSFHQPGGIVTTMSGECAPERKSVFVPWGLDLKSALDIIVPRGSPWLWTQENAVVNVLPREKVPDVMNIKIASHQWNTRDHVRVSVGRLFSFDRVQSYLSERRLVSGLQLIVEAGKATRIVNGVPEVPTGEQHSLTDCTLLEALNRVVASYGRVWMYREERCGGKAEYYLSVH